MKPTPQAVSAAHAEPVEKQLSDAEQLLQEVLIQTLPRNARAEGIAIGHVEAFSPDGHVLVGIPSFGLTGVPARVLAQPVEIGQAVALGFEACDPMRPIILGALLPGQQASLPRDTTDVLLDGEKVTMTAAREIELRCGEAALILSADGRIELRGTYITSHASATQRILGGSVNIN
ncbi:hypothetical protein F2P44_30340 [Massilia sp. CCM 8695]|uniref:DUF6484 domain-containing protein n=1 Tax=Massilia frigida TaxID=2609281 RepID=A0ABX0NIG8_9BURK|nr:DUF6484 domain-containing protein [Massilia frigida]NHZ83534.1 hypothetical protein [Massilia frigida]